NGVLYLGWVGDSRCYLVNGNSIKVLSHDHSLVQSLIDEGSITEEEAFYHPNRNIINQSMGMSNIIPSFEKYSLEDNQILLLCSDGLNGMLRDFEILEICNRHSDLKVMVQSLVDAANKAGGHDNISCIGIRLKDYPARAKIFIKNEHPAGSKKSENKIPLKLILLSIFLIIAFIWVFLVLKSGNDTSLQENDRIHSRQTMPVSPDTTAEEDIGMPVESQGFYFIRLKGFNDSLKAQEYLEQLSNQYNNYVFMINYSSNALYEVTVNGFKDEDEANKFIASGQFPSAIIKLQKE
ncbi:MAG TPA: SPOR domain-containing protein, partial [Saprospiraceae bacterium]|nr:SPOR domain-containing protein [Saprospiraceae bacterium]